MKSEDLKKLPTEAKMLVNDGVYSLYEVAEPGDVRFVLVTNASEFYPLSGDGEVLSCPAESVRSMPFARALHFEGLSRGPAIAVNYA